MQSIIIVEEPETLFSLQNYLGHAPSKRFATPRWTKRSDGYVVSHLSGYTILACCR